MSVQRSADEIVIWPVVKATWQGNTIHRGSRNTSGSATRRAQRGKDRRRLGGTSQHRSPRGLGRHAKPGSILYTPRVNKRSPAQNLASLSPLRWRNQSRDPELPAVVHAAWRRDLRADVTVARWTLHCQETALAAAHHIEGYGPCLVQGLWRNGRLSPRS
jgi:hypothetical protein